MFVILINIDSIIILLGKMPIIYIFFPFIEILTKNYNISTLIIHNIIKLIRTRKYNGKAYTSKVLGLIVVYN